MQPINYYITLPVIAELLINMYIYSTESHLFIIIITRGWVWIPVSHAILNMSWQRTQINVNGIKIVQILWGR